MGNSARSLLFLLISLRKARDKGSYLSSPGVEAVFPHLLDSTLHGDKELPQCIRCSARKKKLITLLG